MKFFTTDLTTGQAGIRIDNGSARALLEECARHGAMVMVHAEDDDLIKYREAKLAREGRDELANAHLVHSTVGEELAVRTMGTLAEEAGAALYIAHVGGEPRLDASPSARAAGSRSTGRRCTTALLLTDDYAKPDGAKYHIGMGLKPPEDRSRSGRARRRPAVDAGHRRVHDLVRGQDGRHGHPDDPGGHVGIETRGIIGFSEGVGKGGFSLERFVEVFSANPARLMGLYPRKGVLAPGSDADVVLWDPASSGRSRSTTSTTMATTARGRAGRSAAGR